MDEKQVSGTALMSAYIRGYHAMHDAPLIFDDFLAHRLLTEQERTILEQHLSKYIQAIDPAKAASCPDHTTALAWSMQFMAGNFLSRARYAEDSLEEAIKSGIQQYVILGAGMDTFAYRYPEMLEHLQVFEVDHPSTQAFKRNRIADLGWKESAKLQFVPIDFTKESLAIALTRSSYNPQAPSFFSWLGVTHYLPHEAVFATLRSIVDIAPVGSIVVFDYYDTDAFVPEKAAKRVQVILKSTRQIGEPVNSGFDPTTIASNLSGLGLRLVENLDPSDIQRRYFQGRTDGYYASEHVHYARAVVE